MRGGENYFSPEEPREIVQCQSYVIMIRGRNFSHADRHVFREFFKERVAASRVWDRRD
jgi:hypothetical protein